MNAEHAAAESISPAELAKLQADGKTVRLIDVRTPIEFQELHVQGAVCVPLGDLDPRQVASSRQSPQEPILLVCRSGARAAEARQRFVQAGVPNVLCVEGGTDACKKARLPLVRGRRVVSLQRQVHRSAGSLVLLGVLLGSLVHPWYYGLSAFVGGGLLFAGITDTCGMAMLLARMPWNRKSGSCSNS